MLHTHVMTTSSQKVLSLLAKFSDKEFYDRQVARRLGISYGSANRALNELFASGAVTRRQEGKMYFYSIDASDAAVIELKKMINLMLVEPLVDQLKQVSNRVVLYGSCAFGTDTSESDLDLFVVSSSKAKVSSIVSDFKFLTGYENIHIQTVIKTPAELLEAGESERGFIEEVERGIVLWERAAGEPRF